MFKMLSRSAFIGLFLGLILSVSQLTHAGTGDIGVVVMHGKWDSPDGHILKFANALKDAGFLVATPEMPWSGRRSYDVGVDGMIKIIDDAVNQLREKGAKKIFVSGHSFGGSASFKYSSLRKVDGVIALAPGHLPEGKVFVAMTAKSVAKAKEMVDSGHGDDMGWFDDPNNGGRMKSINMTAKIYLDYFDPNGPMNFRHNTAAIQPGTPVLWIVGEHEEAGIKRVSQFGFDALPQNPPPKKVEVPGGHMQTPDNSTDIAISWIKEIAGQ